jgi:hypothetical protein
MIYTKEIAVKEWTENIQGMETEAYWMPSDLLELHAAVSQFMEWGYHEVHSTGSMAEAQFYNPKVGKAIVLNRVTEVDGISVWCDDYLSNNDWLLVRRWLTEEQWTTYLVPSKALYDIGTTHGFRRKSTILGYEEDPTGFESTMEILVNNGIAVSLGVFA